MRLRELKVAWDSVTSGSGFRWWRVRQRCSFLKVYYLFIFGCAGFSLLHGLFPGCSEQGLLSSCSGQASHFRGSSCCRAHSGSRGVGFSSCSVWGSWALERRHSSLVHRLICPAACGIFPDQGLNPCLLYWQADSSPLRHQQSPALLFLT